MTLISLGHSNKTFDEFFDLSRYAKIEVIYDVRRRPRSRWPQFSRSALEPALIDRGLGYVWIGDLLGGFRDEGYPEWMKTAAFDDGTRLLEEASLTKRVGFMCSEGLPWNCHRRFVARALSQRGHDVLHLLPDGTLVPEDPQLALPDL